MPKTSGLLAPGWTQDFLASFVVFLVALPLSIGIALASGMPVMSGIITAACGGILVGLIGGAPLQVSGPAAGLTVLVYAASQGHGIEGVFAATVIAGAMQVFASFFKISRFILKTPHSVVDGMLSGIGAIIFMSQLQVVLGGAPLGTFWLNLKQTFAILPETNVIASIIGLGTFVTLSLWKQIPWPQLRLIPGSLVALVIFTGALAIAEETGFTGEVPKVNVPGSLWDSIKAPDFSVFTRWGLYGTATVFAVIASIESLLCAVATDLLHKGPRANLDKELMGQGVGNLFSGLLGGIPMTGVIVRSYANITAGAKTARSAILHGVWMILFVGLLGGVLVHIPLAVMGGLLVHVGVNLVRVKYFTMLMTPAGRIDALAFIATMAGCMFLDLLKGVVLGLVVYVALTKVLGSQPKAGHSH